MTLRLRHSVARRNRRKRDFDGCKSAKFCFISFQEIQGKTPSDLAKVRCPTDDDAMIARALARS